MFIRPGNAPSHAGAGPWIDRASGLVVPHAQRVCVRGDTDYSLTADFDRCAGRADFIFGMDANKTLRSRAQTLPDDAWSRLERPPAYQPATGHRREREPDHKARIVAERGYLNLEDVAEFAYQPGKCTRP